VAVQDGDTTYAPAQRVVRKLVISKGDQTITFPEIQPKAVGEADFSPGAAASSGLPCIYSSSNPAVADIVNNMIRLKGEGSAIITAKQTGNINYNAAAEVSREITVTDPTGIQTIHRINDFEVFPNPAAGFVSIRFNSENPGLVIYNTLGSAVYKNREPDSQIRIPVNEIGRAGIYFIKVNSVVKKLVIGK
jgi:hypothetical protein